MQTEPAIQQADMHASSNSGLTALSALLNPASQQALDSVQASPEPTAPTPVVTPEITPPTPEAAKPETAPDSLKRGFDALEPLEAKPVDTAPSEQVGDPPPPDAKTPEAKNAWWSRNKKIKDLETEREAWLKEKALLSEQATKAKQFTEADPEWQAYQAAKARLEEVEPVVARVAYTKTQAYKETIEAPRKQIQEYSEKLAEAHKIPLSKMFQVFREPDPQRRNEVFEEVTSEMDTFTKQRLVTQIMELEKLDAMEDRMLENAQAAAKEAEAIETQRSQQSAIEKKASEMRAVENSRGKLKNAAALFTLEGENSDSAVESIIKMAQETPFGEQSLDDQTFAVISAGLVPRMSKVIGQYQQKVTTLEAQIAALAGAAPKTGPGSSSASPAQGPTDFVSALGQALAGAGIRI